MRRRWPPATSTPFPPTNIRSRRSGKPKTNSALFGDSAPLLEETCTPNAYNYNNAGGYNVIAQGTHTANSSGIIANRWKKCYEGIGRCNTHLNRLPAAAVADDRRVQMEG